MGEGLGVRVEVGVGVSVGVDVIVGVGVVVDVLVIVGVFVRVGVEVSVGVEDFVGVIVVVGVRPGREPISEEKQTQDIIKKRIKIPAQEKKTFFSLFESVLNPNSDIPTP